MAVKFRRRGIRPHHLWGGAALFVIIKLIVILSLMNSDAGNQITSSIGAAVLAEVPLEKNTSIDVFFCPRDDCEDILYNLIMESEESVHCALYDLNLDKLVSGLINKSSEGLSIRVVVDNNNYGRLEGINFVRKDTSSQLMHNKFCIFDDKKVFTGSFNPTFNGAFKNNNNMVVVKSRLLAQSYSEEFKELWSGVFGKGRVTSNPRVILDRIPVEAYFCPEDWCSNKVLKYLHNAKDSIYFMAFSFTHDKIGDMLVDKIREGVIVRGVMEKRQNNQWAEYDKLVNAGVDVVWDTKNTKGVMHHKVFIIDEHIVITGSFNPTANADTRNDENILIMHDEMIASEYIDEFIRIRD